MSSQPFNPDQELAEFFTDVEYLRDAFKEAVAASTLTSANTTTISRRCG